MTTYPSDLLAVRPGREDPLVLGLPATTWAKAAVIAGLFAALFWPNLRRLWLKTNPLTGEANWGHSCFVPLVGLYYLFLHREALLGADAKPFIWGRFARPGRLAVGLAVAAAGGVAIAVSRLEVGLVRTLVASAGPPLVLFGGLVVALDWSLAFTVAGLALFAYGIWPGQNDYFKDVGMVLTLFGVVLLLCGPGVMRTAWFPIVFLVCAIPWPALVYSWVAEPLQRLAAEVAVDILRVTGVMAQTSGTRIQIASGTPGVPDRVLNVAEACAGMRSLMTFISVAAAIAFLGTRPLWQKLVVVASAVPIAIGCNVFRIGGQGLLDHYVSPKWSESYAHQMVGMVMLVPAFLLILLVGWVLDRLFVEEADDDEGAGVGPTPVPKPAAVVTRPAAVVRPPVARAAVATRPPVVTRPGPRPASPSGPIRIVLPPEGR